MRWKQLAVLLASGCKYFWLTASVCSKSESASSSSPALNFSSPSEKKDEATRSASCVRTRSPSCAWKAFITLSPQHQRDEAWFANTSPSL